MSDVKLDGERVILESGDGNLTVDGALIKANAVDLWLSHKSRLRAGYPAEHRLALAQTFNDGLGINIVRDYPDGVEIAGDVKVLDKLTVFGDVQIRSHLQNTVSKLSVDLIQPESNLLKCIAWDLWLYHPSRLRANYPSEYRRAMVHTINDGVGINLNRDYPGGVEIAGEVKIHDDVNMDKKLELGLSGHLESSSLPKPSPIDRFSSEQRGISISSGSLKAIFVKRKQTPLGDTSSSSMEYNLVDEILSLKNKLEILEKQVEKLTNR
jgi:hypothetical protein